MFGDLRDGASVVSVVNFAIVVEVSVVVVFAASLVDGVGFAWRATAVGVDV